VSEFVDFVLLVTALVLPLHWAVTTQLDWWQSPEYFRRFGVIIRRLEAPDCHAEVIGRYSGVPIYRSVSFKGMEYEFAGVVPPRYCSRIDENELYLEPGLLYLFRRIVPCGGTAATLHC